MADLATAYLDLLDALALTRVMVIGNSAASLYSGVGAEGGTGYLFTLSGGRGFRAIDALYSDNFGRYWVYGHGAEHPDRDGFVLMDHTDCCPTC